ncbi:MAG: CoA-disulfide reductase [Armatimonadetes bacterium]|nr:CoA-disulfide reductase [Armatimonadota bacterium]MCX7967462.1 CoA-disulfide reductase [Armatimonadota bacterium]MDW8143742.1 CoA-disulfide reductase [Armatimonadota bacterium]
MKLVIIGGGAGGATAAARARRLDEHAEIVLFERGEHVSYAHCGLPYYIGGVIQNREALLASTPERFKNRYRVDVRTRTEVKRILRGEKAVEVLELDTGRVYREGYDKLILSPGSSPIMLPIDGVDLDGIFSLRNLSDADKVVRFINERNPQRALVVGAGFIGLELVENLRHRGMEVTLVEMLDQVLPAMDVEMAKTIESELKRNGVNLMLNEQVVKFEREGEAIAVQLKSGRKIEVDMVMLGVGIKPNTELAVSAGLEIGSCGGIKVNKFLQTSDPDIYAIGDAVEVPHFVTGEPVLVPLAGPANKQARIAVDNIYGRMVEYRGVLGTAIVKVFNIVAATTGVNEKALKRLGIRYEKCYLHPYSHATYYPGSTQMTIKLLFSPEDGRIFGAQIVGDEGVDKRIDVLATAILAGMSVDDLTHLELAYAPQFGTAKDAVNIAGYVASNIYTGDAPTACWDEIERMQDDSVVILDVRTQEETILGKHPNAINIPLERLRAQLHELPKDKPIYTYCTVGLRGYIAARILVQNGFNAKNLSGGFRMLSRLLPSKDLEQH